MPADQGAYNALLETLRFVCKVVEGAPATSQFSFGLNVQWQNDPDGLTVYDVSKPGDSWLELDSWKYAFKCLDNLLHRKVPYPSQEKIKFFRNAPDLDGEWKRSYLDIATQGLLLMVFPTLGARGIWEFCKTPDTY